MPAARSPRRPRRAAWRLSGAAAGGRGGEGRARPCGAQSLRARAPGCSLAPRGALVRERAGARSQATCAGGRRARGGVGTHAAPLSSGREVFVLRAPRSLVAKMTLFLSQRLLPLANAPSPTTRRRAHLGGTCSCLARALTPAAARARQRRRQRAVAPRAPARPPTGEDRGGAVRPLRPARVGTAPPAACLLDAMPDADAPPPPPSPAEGAQPAAAAQQQQQQQGDDTLDDYLKAFEQGMVAALKLRRAMGDSDNARGIYEVRRCGRVCVCGGGEVRPRRRSAVLEGADKGACGAHHPSLRFSGPTSVQKAKVPPYKKRK